MLETSEGGDQIEVKWGEVIANQLTVQHMLVR